MLRVTAGRVKVCIPKLIRILQTKQVPPYQMHSSGNRLRASISRWIHKRLTPLPYMICHACRLGPLSTFTDQYAERKVGCDRALPACANCIRARRDCKGYGLKLAWPDKYDGRRKQKKYQVKPDTSATHYVTKFGEFYFLNTTIGDIKNQRYTTRDLLALGRSVVEFSAPRSVSPGLEFWNLDLDERAGTLVSYCECPNCRPPRVSHSRGQMEQTEPSCQLAYHCFDAARQAQNREYSFGYTLNP